MKKELFFICCVLKSVPLLILLVLSALGVVLAHPVFLGLFIAAVVLETVFTLIPQLAISLIFLVDSKEMAILFLLKMFFFAIVFVVIFVGIFLNPLILSVGLFMLALGTVLWGGCFTIMLSVLESDLKIAPLGIICAIGFIGGIALLGLLVAPFVTISSAVAVYVTVSVAIVLLLVGLLKSHWAFFSSNEEIQLYPFTSSVAAMALFDKEEAEQANILQTACQTKVGMSGVLKSLN